MTEKYKQFHRQKCNQFLEQIIEAVGRAKWGYLQISLQSNSPTCTQHGVVNVRLPYNLVVGFELWYSDTVKVTIGGGNISGRFAALPENLEMNIQEAVKFATQKIALSVGIT